MSFGIPNQSCGECPVYLADAETNKMKDLLTLAKDDLLYLLIKLKAMSDNPKECLNEKGVAALYFLQSEKGMSIDKINKDFGIICDYLEEIENA